MAIDTETQRQCVLSRNHHYQPVARNWCVPSITIMQLPPLMQVARSGKSHQQLYQSTIEVYTSKSTSTHHRRVPWSSLGIGSATLKMLCLPSTSPKV